MKFFIKFTWLLFSMTIFKAQSQCADVFTDINTNPYVCGLYGDANGNSNWNWEITNKNNPNWCAMWYRPNKQY